MQYQGSSRASGPAILRWLAHWAPVRGTVETTREKRPMTGPAAGQTTLQRPVRSSR
ncbi:hypothetical protein I552_6309 [Mycobacterium xenopi 3993]|nr:hypothetical protein I552_6309 [Mycobacterium xenopi 3993]